jgi:aryl-alcohol dehydrogenase-like predicted oxidoreductase
MRESLRASLVRLGRDHLDLYILHSYIRPSSTPPLPETIDIETVREVIRPEFQQLVQEGVITGWGLTGAAAPEQLCRLLEEDPPPTAVQCVTNAMNAIGDLWPDGLAGSPDNARIRRTAAARGVTVMGVRALAAGALADRPDRAALASDPAFLDAQRGEGFRALARERGVSAAHLAYLYALSLPGVATVVVGAKHRRELAECVAAEAAAPLAQAELIEVDASCSGHGLFGG